MTTKNKKKLNALKEKATHYYIKYRKAVNQVYEIDDLEGDKLNESLLEMGDLI